MRCQCCKKSQGTIHIRDVENWRTQDHVVVCEECARHVIPLMFDPALPLPTGREALARGRESRESEQVVPGVETESSTVPDLDLGDSGKEEEESDPGILCPTCGLTFKEFRKEGRLGCSQCYEAFGDQLRLIMFRVHGEVEPVHTGHRPGQPQGASRASRRRHIQQLRRQMEAAVEAEAYEKAASIRDQIGMLEKELTVQD